MPPAVPRPRASLPRATLLGVCLALWGCGGDAARAAQASAQPAAAEAPAAPSFDAERAWKHLEAQVALGPRPAGSAAAELAREHIERELEALGLAPRRESFEIEPPAVTGLERVQLANVIAEIETAPAGAPWILVGCHYDTKRWTPDSGLRGHVLGANDGASGVALLLELARVLALASPRACNYRLAFFDAEESFRWRWAGSDNRYGSRHHAAGMRERGEVERFGAMLLVDLVADRSLGLEFDTNSDAWLRAVFFDAARALGHGARLSRSPRAIEDDHLSFKEIGLPVLDLIDLDYPDETNAYWHSDEDTLENVSAESLGIVGAIVERGLAALELRLAGAK